MCGICGWLSLDGSPVDRSIVRAMTSLIGHRGPDGDGHYFDESVGFGHRRLAIIDPKAGDQPLTIDDGSIWVTYNGEIYNFPDLMAELTRRGHTFGTRCDTEVIVRAYAEWGPDFLKRLNGMFAFALWDRRARRLLLARDPFGLKPLYVWRDRRRLLFGSEFKAILVDPTVPREIDRVALDEYLTFQFVPAPRTILQGIEKLRPGHYLMVEDGRVSGGSFVARAPERRALEREPVTIAEIESQLMTAVERQMISDVPVGALLSGGVDSATVASLMQRVSSRPVKTFTVGFEGDFARNELAAARRTAEIIGTEHRDIVIGKRECMEAFEAVVWHLDEPIANTSALAMYWVSRLASDHVKVVLTGQGADEPWAGYPRHRGEWLGEWYRLAPSALRNGVVAPLVNLLPRADMLKRGVYALGTDDFVQRLTDAFTVFTPAMKCRLYRDWPVSDPAESLRYWDEPVTGLETLARHLYIESRFSLPDNLLVYGDKMAMAWSLEARHPLLDLELMRFVEALPARARFRGPTGHKYLYRKAIARWLPDEILRRRKVAFETPFDEWLQREITGDIREKLTSPDSACARYFDTGYIGELVERHAARRQDYTRMLVNLLFFEEWHRRFLGGPDGPPPADSAVAGARPGVAVISRGGMQ